MKKIKNILMLTLALVVFITPIANAMEVEDGAINGDKVVSIEEHDGHYHLKTENGTEYVVDEDPSDQFPGIEVTSYSEDSHGDHNHDHDHDHDEHDHGHQHTAEDRELKDFSGDWTSIIKYYEDGSMDEAVKELAAELEISEEEAKKEDMAYYATDYYRVVIDGETISFFQGDQELSKGNYEYKGFEVEEESGYEMVWYQFELKDANDKLPKYVAIFDNQSSSNVEHDENYLHNMHFVYSNTSFEDAIEGETSPYYVETGAAGQDVQNIFLGLQTPEEHNESHGFIILEDIPEEYRDKTPTKLSKHGNHWHLFYEDGSEIGVHGDPTQLYPDVEVEEYEDHEHEEGHDHEDHNHDDEENHNHEDHDHDDHNHDHEDHNHDEDSKSNSGLNLPIIGGAALLIGLAGLLISRKLKK